MSATLDRPCLGEVVTDWPFSGRCGVATNGNSVQGVQPTDALLTARLAAGDDDALVEVFDRLAPVVQGAALRVLGQVTIAQDVVQDVFVELWCHPERYDPVAGTLRTYLVVLARHRALDLVPVSYTHLTLPTTPYV